MSLAAVADRLAALEVRLDARRPRQAPGQLELGLATSSGQGKPCGESFIAPQKQCRKGGGKAAAPKAPAAAPKAPAAPSKPSLTGRMAELHAETQKRLAEEKAQADAAREKLARPDGPGVVISGPELSSPDSSGNVHGLPTIDGRPPSKRLGGGAYGDTYLFELKDGRRAVVKVDRLTNFDPLADGNSLKPSENERMLMVQRELAMLTTAAAVGVAPRPLSTAVSKLPDGRFAFAYEFQPGATLTKDHTTNELTEQAAAILSRPGAMGRYAEGIARLARAMAEAGLEHRDEHGGNLLLLEDGTPQLLDWAMAKDVPTTAQQQGLTESRLLGVFGDMVGVTRAGPGGRPALAIDDAIKRAYKAQFAGDEELEDWVMQQKKGRDPTERMSSEEFRERMNLANQIQRQNKGKRFIWAQIEAGLSPKPPPDVLEQALGAADRAFGPEDLAQMRREIDQHMAAWRGNP
jgi:hypothetical protein